MGEVELTFEVAAGFYVGSRIVVISRLSYMLSDQSKGFRLLDFYFFERMKNSNSNFRVLQCRNSN